VQALHRVAARSTPTYHALVVAVRRSPVVAPDETGWKVGGRLWWLWVFITRDVTVYAIQPGRGYVQAAAILGPPLRRRRRARRLSAVPQAPPGRAPSYLT